MTILALTMAMGGLNSGRGDYRRQQHYHNTISKIDKLSRFYHESSFEGNLKKQELSLMLVPIASDSLCMTIGL